MSTLPCRSLPKELSPSYFPRFPFRPPCRRWSVAPSQRLGESYFPRSPSVHPVVAEVSLPPNGALPKLFPTVSRPSTLSSLMSFPPRQSKLYKREHKHRRYFWETRWAREPKSKTAHSTPFLKILWCGQLCSERNRRKIFTETSCALVSGAAIHHSMLCQLHLHSSSRYYCFCN